MGRLKAIGKKSTSLTNSPECKIFQFSLNAAALIICKQKFSRQAVSASVHLLSIGLLSYLFAVSAEANYNTMGRIT